MPAPASSPVPRDPSEGWPRRAAIAAGLALLTVVGLWNGVLSAAPQPPLENNPPAAEPIEEPIGPSSTTTVAPLQDDEVDVLVDTPPPPITLPGVPADDRGPAALLPASGAVAYVSWAGGDAAGPALKQTAAYDALMNSGLFPEVGRSFDAILEQGIDKARRSVEEAIDRAQGRGDARFDDVSDELDGFEDDEFEDEFEDDGFDVEVEVEVEELDGDPFKMTPELKTLQALGEAAFDGGAALSVNILEGGPPLPSVFLVLPGAADEAEAALSLASVEERDRMQLQEEEVNGVKVLGGLPPGAPPFYHFAFWRVGEHFVAAIGPGAVPTGTAVTAGGGEALGTRALAESTPDDALIAGWIDFATIVDTFGEFPVHDAPWRREGPIALNDVLVPLGLDALAGMRGSLSADGKALRTEGEWTLRGEARGLLVALDPASMTRDDLPPMPVTVGSFGAASVDAARIFDGVVEALEGLSELAPPDSQPQQMLSDPNATINGLAGFDVRAGLIEPLGGVTAFYSDPADGGLFGMGAVVAMSVDDAAALRDGMAAVANRVLPELPPEASEGVMIATNERYGTDVTTISVGGLFRPSLAVTDEWAVFAPTPQSVAAFLLRADGKLPTWEPTGDWEEPFARVPEEFTVVSGADPRPAAAFLNKLIGTLLPPVNQFAGGRSDAALPPSELVTGPLFPNVSWAVNTGAGVKGTGYSSLPAPGCGGGSPSSMAAIPIAAGSVALLLPAVQAARAAARRTQSANNLKQQTLAAHNYDSTYATFPRGTVEAANLKPEQRLSWIATVLPYLEEGALAKRLDAKQAWNAGPNAAAARRQIPSMINPALDEGSESNDDGYALTHYVGIAGVGEDAAASKVRTNKTGMFGYDRATSIRSVTDGTSNTLLQGSVQADLGPWAQGGPSTVRAFTKKPYIGGPDGFGGGEVGGTNFSLVDGSVQFISEDIDPQVLEAMATTQGGEVFDLDF